MLSRRRTSSEVATEGLKERACHFVFPLLIEGLLTQCKGRAPASNLNSEELSELFKVAASLTCRLIARPFAERKGLSSTGMASPLFSGTGNVGWHDGLTSKFRIPSAYLAKAMDLLGDGHARLCPKWNPIDSDSLDAHILGSVYEELLNLKLVTGTSNGSTRKYGKRIGLNGQSDGWASSADVWLVGDKSRRRDSGSYYTPEVIIRYIISHTLGPVLRAKLRALRKRAQDPDLVDRLFDLKVLDPAMGCGYFLLEAVRFTATRLHRFLKAFPSNPVSRQLQSTRCRLAKTLRNQEVVVDPNRLSDIQLLKHHVLERCIYGVDLDPLAVELAKLTLWLDAALPGLPCTAFGNHFRCGNSLLELSRGRERFDAVVGNPPYGAKLEPGIKEQAIRLLPQMRHNADTAVGFIELSARLVNDPGRVGLLVPKPFTYSFAWKEARHLLHRRIRSMVDVSRAWKDVLLEQTIVLFGATQDSQAYRAGTLGNGKITSQATLSWDLVDHFDTLPCALEPVEIRRLQAIRSSGITLGQVCRSFRGIPGQRHLARPGGLRVLGGRDLERWHIRSCSGHLPESGPDFDLSAFRREKLVFQNIIAHVTKPEPHIVLIGAHDAVGTVTLDTVNNIVARSAGVDLHGVLGFLHSELINWLVYTVIYNKAIRTMHFDQYFLNKIPLPLGWEKLFCRIAPLARTCQVATAALAEKGSVRDLIILRKRAQEKLDRLVNQAFGEHANTPPRRPAPPAHLA